MKKDNRGLSLVEVIIVITIMAVLGGLMTMGISAGVSKPAEECAEKLEAALNNARITTMGKQSVELELYKQNNYIYLKEKITGADGTYSEKDTRIGAKGVEVTYKLTGETHVALDTTPVKFKFKRTTGGFEPVSVSPDKYCEELVISKGTRIKKMNLYYLTGKVMIE